MISTPTYEKPLSNFLCTVEKWKPGIASARVEYLAVEIAGAWVLAHANIALLAFNIDEKDACDIKTSHIRAGRFAINLSLEEADNMIEGIILGRLNIGALELSLPDDKLSFYQPWSDSELSAPRLEIKADTRGICVNVDSPRANAELQTGSVPFDGLNDLLTFFGLAQNGHLPTEHGILLTLQPPLDLILDGCCLENDQLSLHIKKRVGIDAGEVSLGLRLFPGPCVSRRFQASDQIVWETVDDNWQVGMLAIQLENCSGVQVFLAACGIPARRHYISDLTTVRNQRVQAYLPFDKNLRKLAADLHVEPGASARDLEVGVSLLFFLMGGSTAKPPKKDAVDVLLVTPRGQVAVIECTTQLNEAESKVSKLATRRALVAASLTSQPAEVNAILIVNRPREEISKHSGLFAQERIITLAIEDIDELLVGVADLTDVDQFLTLHRERLDQVLLATMNSMSNLQF